MSFNRVLDQKVPKKILSGALRRNLLASAYLFYGDQGTGKWTMALELAKAINCEKNCGGACDVCSSCLRIDKMIHPDVKMIFPVPSAKTDEKSQKEIEKYKKLKIQDPYVIVRFEKNINIPVEQIRAMQREIYLKPFEGKRKVIIIAEAEKMHISSANSLLKTLEEPPLDTNLILTSNDMNKLLPTVVSRCQQIRFGKIPAKIIEEKLMEAHQTDKEKASYCANISNGSYGRALDFLRGEKESLRQDAVDLLGVATEGKTSQIIRMVNQMLQRWDRNSILEMFEFLISIFRDIYMVLEGYDRLINSDMAPDVVKLSEKFERQNKVEYAFRMVDQIRFDCQIRNASQKLGLLSLCLKIKELSQRKATIP
ncbi:MAG: DNA polymerase III subunit delta' [candidate division Zixibacteria bacterium]|nr:DNA polymerase III subunit delta' [candidate division Zixibacteria bacterium]